MGDLPGHPFRGNQWTSAGKASDYGGPRAADDGHYYHVTTPERAERILKEGLVPDAGPRSMGEGFYRDYSRGKVFFSERDGVAYWAARVAEHLEQEMDDPPELVVVKVPKSAVDPKAVEVDELGSKDSYRKSFYSRQRVGATPAELRQYLKNPARAVTRTPEQPELRALHDARAESRAARRAAAEVLAAARQAPATAVRPSAADVRKAWTFHGTYSEGGRIITTQRNEITGKKRLFDALTGKPVKRR